MDKIAESGTTPITPDRLKRYLESDGSECPFCGSGMLRYGKVEWENPGMLSQRITCICRRSWRNVYTLTHAVALGPNSEQVEP